MRISKFKNSIVVNSLLFIAGFTAVFVSFGASASLIGQVLITYQDHIRRIGGILIIIFGLYLVGDLEYQFFADGASVPIRKSDRSAMWDRFLIGVAFAGGVDPLRRPCARHHFIICQHHRLVAERRAIADELFVGLGLPLFFTALGVDRFLAYFKQARVYLWGVSTVSGVLLDCRGRHDLCQYPDDDYQFSGAVRDRLVPRPVT